MNVGGRLLAIWREALFGAVATLAVYLTVVHAMHLAINPWYVTPLWLLCAAGAWWRPVIAVAAFVAAVPALNGATLVWSGPAGNPWTIVFSGLFLSWYVKRRFVAGHNLAPTSRATAGADVLMTMTLASLLTLLLRYPGTEVYPAVFRELTLNQFVLLYGVQAAAVLIQGLMLFRIVVLEQEQIDERVVTSALLAVAGAVVVYAVVQVGFDLPVWRGLIGKGRRGIFSPFDDIHSYGSAVVLLWPVVVFLAVRAQGRVRLVLSALAVLLAGCAVMSLSRTTWVALAAAVVLSAWHVRRRQIAAAMIALVLLGAGAVGVLYARNVPIPFIALSTRDLTNPAVLSQRFYQWNVAASMIRDAPLSGVGVGSFLRLFPFYSDFDPVVDANPYSVRAPANAHNYYLQLAAELGIPATLTLLFIVGSVIVAAWRRPTKEPGRDWLAKGLSVGVTSYLISSVSGHPLLLPAQQFLFWFAVGALAWSTGAGQQSAGRQTPARDGSLGRPMFWVIGVVLVAAAAGHAHRAWVLPASAGFEYGVYPVDNWQDERIRWTAEDARVPLKPASDIIVLRLLVDPHNIGRFGLRLAVRVNGAALEEATFTEPGNHYLYYYVPGLSASYAPSLGLTASRTFNPKRLGLSTDYRDLGVAIAAIGYLPMLPPGGIGFYQWEVPEVAGLPLPVGEAPTRFRWTRRQATIPVEELSPADGARLRLCVRHPDLHETPVSVDVLADGRRLRTVTMTDTEWTRILLTPEQLAGVHGLTLRVDRTWNPRAARVADDARDLGVAVVVE